MKLTTTIAMLVTTAGAMASTNVTILHNIAGTEYQENNAGEFIVKADASLGLAAGTADSLSADTFESFCLELNEHISIGSSYVATINTAAVSGGVGGGNPDPLGESTAWLYTQFRTGALDYAYSGTVNIATTAGMESFNRNDTARALQLAIWLLEDEIGSLSEQAASAKERRLAQVYVDQANTNGVGFGLGRVRVLNMRDTHGGNHQDILALVVPLPGSAAMGGLALAGLAGRRRRRSI